MGSWVIPKATKERKYDFFRVICLIFLFDPQSPNRAPRSWPTFIFYLVLICVSIYPTWIVFERIFTQRLSLALIAYVNQVLISYMIMVGTIVLICFRRTELFQLLATRNSRNWRQYAFICVLNIPPIILHINTSLQKHFDDMLTISVFNACYLHRTVLRTLPVVLYLEALSILKMRAQKLLQTLADAPCRCEDIVREKWLIRDSIETLNANFAALLTLYYFQTSMGNIVLVSCFVTSTWLSLGIIFSACQASLYLAIYTMVKGSSELAASLYQIEVSVLRLMTGPKASSRWCSPFQWRVLHYDETLESPKIAWFRHSQATFVSFLVTNFTCLAVVMQFDYKVVRVVNDLAEKYGKARIFE